MENGRLPDFLVIGTAKAGTTSLYYYLMQHPRVFMPSNKEPMFFAFDGKNLDDYHFGGSADKPRIVTNLTDYVQLFQNAPATSMAGEASTLYLYDKDAPARIATRIPKVKLIAILRNPVDRAYSQFQHYRQVKREPLSRFVETINVEQKRMAENWYPSYFYADMGFYGRQLRNYFQYFPRDQFKIFLYEDLADTASVTGEIFDFIGVERNVDLDTSGRYNVSGETRFPALFKLVRKSTRIKPFLKRLIDQKNWQKMKQTWDRFIQKKYAPMLEEDREKMKSIFHDDILDLQDLIDRDLSSWL